MLGALRGVRVTGPLGARRVVLGSTLGPPLLSSSDRPEGFVREQAPLDSCQLSCLATRSMPFDGRQDVRPGLATPGSGSWGCGLHCWEGSGW